MGGRKAQIALFVLAGIIILFMVVLTIYLISQKKAETQTSTNEQLALQQNPELAAEKARMQTRVNDCLATTSQDALADFSDTGTQVTSVDDAGMVLADDISSRFPSCFFQYNTGGALTITQEDAPTVTATLGETQLAVQAKYTVQGVFQDKTYALTSFSAQVPTTLKAQVATEVEAKQAFEDPARYGSMDGFVTPDGFFNPNAKADEGIEADLLLNPDGSCVFYTRDYSKVWDGTATDPQDSALLIGKCALAQPTQTTPLTQEQKPAAEITCSLNADQAAPCAILDQLDASFKQGGVTYLSSLSINPFTGVFDASEELPGTYTGVASRTLDDGSTVTQQFTVTIA